MKSDYEDLRKRSGIKLRFDLIETFFSKLLIPSLILYYDHLPWIWSEAGFLANRIAFKGQEKVVQMLFFASILRSIDLISSWTFNPYDENKNKIRDDNYSVKSVFSSSMSDPHSVKIPEASRDDSTVLSLRDT